MTLTTGALALAGCLAIAIPILIHLLWRQRRKPVRWGAMRFLLEAYKRHRRRLRVEQLLLLIVRCLILAILGFALARPLLDAGGLVDGGSSRVVYLIIDDGLASGVQVTTDERALDQHVTQAVEIIRGLDASDRVGVITAARPSQATVVPASSDHGAVVRLLEGLEPADAGTDLIGAVDRLRDALRLHEDDRDPVLAYVLSEFREGSANLDTALPAIATSLDLTLRASPPAADAADNVSIASIDPVRHVILAGATDGSSQVTVRLVRDGANLGRAVSRVELTGTGIARTPAKVVQWEPGRAEESVDFLLDFGDQRDAESGISVRIDDDALTADNDRHAVLALRRNIRAVLIDRLRFGLDRSLDRMSSGQWITRALEPTDTSPIEVIQVEPAALHPADLRPADVVIVPRPDLLDDASWTLVATYVDEGGVLILTPPDEVNVHQWTDPMRTALGLPWTFAREVVEHPNGLPLADEQPMSAMLGLIATDLDDLTRPIVAYRALPVDPGATGGETLLVFADGTPFVTVGTTSSDDGPGLGLVAYLATAPQLEWTNLPSKPLMVPLFQEMIRQGLSALCASRPVAVGDRPSLSTHRAARRVIGPEGRAVPLDAERRPTGALSDAGLYRIEDATNQEVGALAVNIEPAAARTHPQPESAVGLWLERAGAFETFDLADPTAALRRAEGGAPIAGLLLVIVLVLLIVETILARWFSHALRSTLADGRLGGGLMTTMGEVAAREAGSGGTP